MNTKQLAQTLKVSYLTAYRIAKTLKFNTTRETNRLIYHFDKDHPMAKSISLLEGSAKPLYTISEIAKLWQWRKGPYSRERVRQLLSEYDIPVYNQSSKGLIFLCDLKKLLK